MREVVVPTAALAAMRESARVAYPEECCGFLLSAATDASDPDSRSIRGVLPATNRSDGERRRRFVILPAELRAAEDEAAGRGSVVTGFYHSHPDHPARPSVFDQEHAWPWYAYLILSSGRTAGENSVGAFELDPERREFREVTLRIGAGLPRGVADAGARRGETEGVT